MEGYQILRKYSGKDIFVQTTEKKRTKSLCKKILLQLMKLNLASRDTEPAQQELLWYLSTRAWLTEHETKNGMKYFLIKGDGFSEMIPETDGLVIITV